MSKHANPAAEKLETALLYFGRSPQELAAILETLLSPQLMEDFAKSAGKRKAGRAKPSQVLADAIIAQPKARAQVASFLHDVLPAPLKLPKSLVQGKHAIHLSGTAKLGVIRLELESEEEGDWLKGQEHLLAWSDSWQPAEPASQEKVQESTPAPKEIARAKKLEKEKRNLEQRIAASEKEIARLQDQVGSERGRRAQLKEEISELKSERDEALQRAAQSKKKLQGSQSVSKREAGLLEDVEKLSHRIGVVSQKVDILTHERDDLRACLEDYDHFLHMEEEEVPSFRDRPLTKPELELVGTVLEHNQTQGTSFRILVIGGGEPQFRHLDKFKEYAEVMGFQGEWRMAEYVSWNKEMKRLKQDMEKNYDALVILHWNRTTFTKNARAICNAKNQKPCITCHYEGFVNLRQTLQECLGQLLRRG
ncbi:MAG: hypothetical protein CMJ96_02500 [Planctomycetes bacterium]|jgi:hypothetical protein|nr:hypothetical protein [Planctomycetota bacterium]MDP7246680.1 hypothetical protein [Planctomycetota bacterium]|tara:strand:- start:9245 stop:10510 length:1266 start_codon:yes stop_codon:yes gene_type:complete